MDVVSVIDIQLVNPAIRKVSVGGCDARGALFIPNILVLEDFIPVTCVLLSGERVSNRLGLGRAWTPSPSC